MAFWLIAFVWFTNLTTSSINLIGDEQERIKLWINHYSLMATVTLALFLFYLKQTVSESKK